MKLLPILTLALFTFQIPAAAQINRTSGDRLSELGTFTASSNPEAATKCTARGGNIAVHNLDGSYTCFYWGRLAR